MLPTRRPATTTRWTARTYFRAAEGAIPMPPAPGRSPVRARAVSLATMRTASSTGRAPSRVTDESAIELALGHRLGGFSVPLRYPGYLNEGFDGVSSASWARVRSALTA